MLARKERESKPAIPAEYIVIGAGPAAICAIAKLYGSGVLGNRIVWIASQFRVGDFGTKLSVGSSVPGNTTVESYQKVNYAIYNLVPECVPTAEEKAKFEMNALSLDATCSLRIAAQPLQQITEKLRSLVCTIEGNVATIHETKEGLRLGIQSLDGSTRFALAKRVLLAVGAEPKTMSLPNAIKIIHPNIAFIQSELRQYLNENPGITRVAVIGSSHSAALATMHLLQAGIAVKQFMNKKYKFATPTIATDGTRYTQFDNTGLKGQVAVFTRKLLTDSRLCVMWQCYIGENIDALLGAHLSGCTHAVVCIGYTASPSLQINDLPLAAFKHNRQTTQILNANGQAVSGVFGIGVAFPLAVQTITGELESAVGVGKFWFGFNDKVLTEWKNHPAEIASYSNDRISLHVIHALKNNSMFCSAPGQAHGSRLESIQLGAKL